MASVQTALESVASRLQSLKAALSERQLGSDGEASQLLAMARELEVLLKPQAPEDVPAVDAGARGTHEANNGDQAEKPSVHAAAKVMGLPATPFDHRRAPAEGPATALKAAAPTPGGGLPATTPLAAEVLASLNAVAGADGSAAAPAGPGAAAAAVAPPLPVTADKQEGDAAATLSGLLSGSLEPRLSAVESSHPLLLQQQGQTQQQQQAAPALASLLQEAALAPQPPAMHSAAMAAAAAALAAGPALPVPRRQSAAAAAPAALLSIPGLQQREQRPCNCKRSMCLKMYCECFASGGFCAPSCSCLNCSNTPAEMAAVQAAREVVLAKNPNAFEVKVTASEGHKRGCRCKRSKCLKKYCECFHAGARCNPDVCQCEDCRNTDGDALLAPVLSKQRIGMPPLQQGWADASADVLAMFQQPLALGPPTAVADAAAADSSSSGGRHGRAGRALQLPLPPPMPLPPIPGFAATAFGPLPPMPEPAAPASLAGFDPATAAAASALGAFAPAALFAPPPPPLPAALDPAAAAAFMMNPVAAAAAATLAEQQQPLEESMADAVSCPAPPAALAACGGPEAAPGPAHTAAAAPAVTPGGAAGALQMASALTAHLSDVAGAIDSEMHDTATSPAPHMAIAKLAARRNLMNAAPTLTGRAAGPLGRPPLPSGRVPSRAASPDSQLSHGSADENGGDSYNTAGSQRSKRPRRAASGGVLGAVAAEASEWGLEMVSPPLKRANSLPAALEQSNKGSGRSKVSDRVALLKKALVGETAAAAAAAAAASSAALRAPAVGSAAARLPALLAEVQCAPTAEDEDAISALFELSSSVC